jgi:hypothetical protein
MPCPGLRRADQIGEEHRQAVRRDAIAIENLVNPGQHPVVGGKANEADVRDARGLPGNCVGVNRGEPTTSSAVSVASNTEPSVNVTRSGMSTVGTRVVPPARDRRQRIHVAEGTEIVEKTLNLRVRRRYEGGGTRVVAAATDPVLHGTHLAGVLLEPGSGKQVPVDIKKVVGGDLRLRVAQMFDRPVHGCNVVEHLDRSDVGWLHADDLLRLRAKQSATADFEAFDPG